MDIALAAFYGNIYLSASPLPAAGEASQIPGGGVAPTHLTGSRVELETQLSTGRRKGRNSSDLGNCAFQVVYHNAIAYI